MLYIKKCNMRPVSKRQEMQMPQKKLLFSPFGVAQKNQGEIFERFLKKNKHEVSIVIPSFALYFSGIVSYENRF